MTIRFTLTLAVEGAEADGRATSRIIGATIERDALTAEALGLTLAEVKAILAELQAAVVAEQVEAHEATARRCLACGTDRGIKGHQPLTCRTVFGTLALTATRLRRCRCGADRAAGDRASFSPLADLLPGRTTPELLYLETRWGALVSYGLAARMLGDVLPMERPVAPERVRRHLQAVVACEEAAMGDEPDGATWAWSGCQRDLDEMSPPDGPAYVGVDGGFVRDRAGSWFEVVVGKSVPGFGRNAPEDQPPLPAKCFAFVQAHDDRPRLLDVLAAQGYAPNQKLVLMSDGSESVRRLVARIGPETEHVLDWFHITMRLTVMRQMTKGACPADPGWTEQRLRDLERLKRLLWHGHARQAVDAAQELADDAWGREEDVKEEGAETVETRGKLGRLHTTAEELATYLRRNAGQIINYGERHRAGERISTGFVESAVNQVVSKRFSKKQSMRWTQAGAHLALQARTRVLNGELDDAFRRRWPGFRPQSKARPDGTKNGSFA